MRCRLLQQSQAGHAVAQEDVKCGVVWVQASGASGIVGQNRLLLPLSNGVATPSSALLDPVFTGTPLRHATQSANQTRLMSQLQAPSGLLSSQAAPANIWQQHSSRQGAMSPSFSGPTGHAGSAVSSYLPQQQSGRGWSGPVHSLQPPTLRSTHQADNGSLNDSLERRHSGNGLDLLQSAQGMAVPSFYGPCS